jgi:hypothetical protein
MPATASSDGVRTLWSKNDKRNPAAYRLAPATDPILLDFSFCSSVFEHCPVALNTEHATSCQAMYPFRAIIFYKPL